MGAKELKLYVLVREAVPLGLAMAAVGHAVGSACLKWIGEPYFDLWRQWSFKKVICKVTDKEFEQAKEAVGPVSRIVMTESMMNDKETAMVVMPHEDMPKMLKYLRLYR